MKTGYRARFLGTLEILTSMNIENRLEIFGSSLSR